MARSIISPTISMRQSMNAPTAVSANPAIARTHTGHAIDAVVNRYSTISPLLTLKKSGRPKMLRLFNVCDSFSL